MSEIATVQLKLDRETKKYGCYSGVSSVDQEIIPFTLYVSKTTLGDVLPTKAVLQLSTV